MRGYQVVPVEAVFAQQLPVGFDRVLVGTGDHPHPFVDLVFDQVKVFPGPAR